MSTADALGRLLDHLAASLPPMTPEEAALWERAARRRNAWIDSHAAPVPRSNARTETE